MTALGFGFTKLYALKRGFGKVETSIRVPGQPIRRRSKQRLCRVRADTGAGKKINGRKRHILVDTLGLMVAVIVTTACVQDRDGLKKLLSI